MTKLLIPFMNGIHEEIPPPPIASADGTYQYPVDQRQYLQFVFENIQDDKDVNQIKTCLEEHDRLYAALENFEKARTIVTVAVEEGRVLEPTSIKILNVHIGMTSRVANIPFTLPSVGFEGLDKTQNRLLTKIASESFLDKVIEFSKKLAEKIMQLWHRVVAFLKKLFNRDEATRKKLEQQQQEIEGLSESANVPKKINAVAKEDFGHLDVFMDQVPFGINGRCDYETTSKVIENTSTLIKANRTIVLEIVECMKSLTEDKIDYSKVLNEVENLVEDIKRNIGHLPLNFKKTVSATVTYSYGHLVSEKACVIQEQMGRSQEHDKVFNIEVDIQSKSNRTAYIPDTLRKSEMSKLVIRAMKLLTEIKDLDKVTTIVENVLKRTVTFLNSKLDDQTPDDRRNIHLVLGLIKDLFRYISTMLPKVSRDASNVSASVTYYVKSSIGVYPH